MGMFDSVMVPCPQCGEEHEAQSKSGLCCMDTYPLRDAPDVTLTDVNRHAPFTCAKCACLFQVNIPLRTTQQLDGGAFKTKSPPFQDRAESFIKKLTVVRTASTPRTGVKNTMNPNELKLAARLLRLAADEFSNHGCNDLDIPNTDENWSLVCAMEAEANFEERAPRPPLGRSITTIDFMVMRHLADCMDPEAK